MITIKDEALKPFYLLHDYNDFRLLKEGDTKIIERGTDISALLQNIIKRKISMLDGEMNLVEFNSKCKEIHEGVAKAFGVGPQAD